MLEIPTLISGGYMSTKIYNGVTLDFSNNPWDRVEEIRGVCERTFEELNREFTTDKVFTVYSSFVCNTVNKHPLALEDGIALEALKNFKERDLQKDLLYCKVLIFPPNKSGVQLGFVSGKDEYYDNLLKEIDYVSEYNYWNNTDMPERMTREQWRQRSQEWEEILERGYLLGSVGLSIELPQTKSRTFDLFQLREGLNINEKELRTMSRDLVFKRMLSKDGLLNETGEIVPGLNNYDVMSSLMESRVLVADRKLEELPFTRPLEISTEHLLSSELESIPIPEFNKENLESILASLDV